MFYEKTDTESCTRHDCRLYRYLSKYNPRFSPIKEHPTRKDWRHNDVLSGTNNRWFKRQARRQWRRRSKSEDCGPYRKETGDLRYDINDFK